MSYLKDEHYIERVLQGDHSSYAMLVERHKDMVFTLAYRMLKNREEAEEVAQDEKVPEGFQVQHLVVSHRIQLIRFPVAEIQETDPIPG